MSSLPHYPHPDVDLNPNVYLNGLGIDLKLPHGVYVRDDGEVKDLLEHLATSHLELMGMIAKDSRCAFVRWFQQHISNPFWTGIAKDALVQRREFKNLNEEAEAICFEEHLDRKAEDYGDLSDPPEVNAKPKAPYTGRKLFILAKKAGLDEERSVFADGYKEALFLDRIGQHNLVRQAIEAEGIALDPEQSNGQALAKAAGRLALRRAEKSQAKVSKITFGEADTEGGKEEVAI